jgi:prefoldin alpha subunit
MERLTPEERERLQRILSELGDYQAAVDVLRQQLSILSASLSELSMSSEAIKTLKELKSGTEILVPLGSNSFIPAKLEDTNKIITGLGANVSAEYDTEGALRILEGRKAEVERAITQTREQLGKLGERIETLAPEAERILERIRKEQSE